MDASCHVPCRYSLLRVGSIPGLLIYTEPYLTNSDLEMLLGALESATEISGPLGLGAKISELPNPKDKMNVPLAVKLLKAVVQLKKLNANSLSVGLVRVGLANIDEICEGMHGL